MLAEPCSQPANKPSQLADWPSRFLNGSMSLKWNYEVMTMQRTFLNGENKGESAEALRPTIKMPQTSRKDYVVLDHINFKLNFIRSCLYKASFQCSCLLAYAHSTTLRSQSVQTNSLDLY